MVLIDRSSLPVHTFYSACNHRFLRQSNMLNRVRVEFCEKFYKRFGPMHISRIGIGSLCDTGAQ